MSIPSSGFGAQPLGSPAAADSRQLRRAWPGAQGRRMEPPRCRGCCAGETGRRGQSIERSMGRIRNRRQCAAAEWRQDAFCGSTTAGRGSASGVACRPLLTCHARPAAPCAASACTRTPCDGKGDCREGPGVNRGFKRGRLSQTGRRCENGPERALPGPYQGHSRAPQNVSDVVGELCQLSHGVVAGDAGGDLKTQRGVPGMVGGGSGAGRQGGCKAWQGFNDGDS